MTAKIDDDSGILYSLIPLSIISVMGYTFNESLLIKKEDVVLLVGRGDRATIRNSVEKVGARIVKALSGKVTRVIVPKVEDMQHLGDLGKFNNKDVVVSTYDGITKLSNTPPPAHSYLQSILQHRFKYDGPDPVSVIDTGAELHTLMHVARKIVIERVEKEGCEAVSGAFDTDNQDLLLFYDTEKNRYITYVRVKSDVSYDSVDLVEVCFKNHKHGVARVKHEVICMDVVQATYIPIIMRRNAKRAHLLGNLTPERRDEFKEWHYRL